MSVTRTLQSEIINQKKQLIFKVEQTTDYAFPNEDYKYYLYLKNISGVDIDNIHIKVNNPSEVIINEAENGEGVLEIGTLKSDEVKLIYLKANCQTTGRHFVHFICYGDGTGLYYKTLKINCAYTHTADELIHRIHIYDFTPYEDTYSMRVEDYSNQVTQLFKTQKLPFKAGEHPFPMKAKDTESDIRPFSNVEHESFIEQNNLLKNSKEHVYQYISRENFNENAVENFEGKNLIDLINNINQNSKFFRARFLKTGTNQLETNFKQYEPNGFIYRFGLLNSEIYHYLGALPTYTYMSDYLFRWAPDGKEPAYLYPQKIAMRWADKCWTGRGWLVYRIATPEYMQTDEFKDNKEERWKVIGQFKDKKSAESCVEREIQYDNIVAYRLERDFNNYQYEIRESYYDTGVFFIHIPINKIPSNFYLLDTDSLEALIQRAKPFGTKALIRYMVEATFDNHMEFMHYPIFKPYFEFDMSDIEYIPYFIQSNKKQLIQETKCGETIEYYGLKPFGKTEIYNYPFEHDMFFEVDNLVPTIYMADKTQELIQKNIQNCQNNQQCINYVKNERPYPDNTINQDIEQYTSINTTKIHNDLTTLQKINMLLYQNNFDNIAFYIPTHTFNTYRVRPDEEVSMPTDLEQWFTNNRFNLFSRKIQRVFDYKNDTSYYQFETQKKYCSGFRIPIVEREAIDKSNGEIGIGLVDAYNKYHLFSLKHNDVYSNDVLNYATVYNNNYKVKRDGYENASALVVKLINIDNDYKNIIAAFFIEYEDKLHYFHHIICANPSEVFVFASNNLTETEPSKILGYSYNKKDKVTFETPFVGEIDNYETNLIKEGEGWINLYRINKAENSYTFIHNTTNEMLDINDIVLHFDNINIPEKAQIESIRLKTILSSSHRKGIYCETSYQNNYILEEAYGNSIKLMSDNREYYPQTNESLYFYHKQLENTNNQRKITKLQNLINDNIIFNESIDFTDNIELINPFWIETSEFTSIPYDCNEIEDIELVIEGFNHGSSVNILSQLLYEDAQASVVSNTVNNGYFYKKINLPFFNSFLMDWIRLRFRFENLNDKIEIFDYYLNVRFKNKQKYDIEYEETDDINNIDKNIHYIDLFKDGITAEELNNGITAKLSFDSLNPGEQYRIYSNELFIRYKIPETKLLINKNKFMHTNKEELITVSGKANDGYVSGCFYNDTNHIAQIYSEVNANNLGLELRDSVYQAFRPHTSDITAIQIYPNGFKGSPDASLKLGIYENRGSTPGKLLKEVYANGWSKNNTQLKNLNSIKYEINIEGLKPHELYWFKLEVENPSKNSYYLLKYTTRQRGDYKLLLKENNDYINTSGSLEFSIYSKDMTHGFSQLPTVEDSLINPYIQIGLYKGVSTLSNLIVKELNEEKDKVIFNGNF